MSIHYEVISEDNVFCIKDLVNELMAYQKSIAHIVNSGFKLTHFQRF